ncbi:hypothetical protein CAC42_2144 [Sphaceloma murrayae]|uniref:CENP-V/GFA domain-containing protein n=1 Tax=Sphaceloma murrayae TaxID=2082308 RepID=A0A2K1QIC4_9PEZI|nr:hypothetical protein CAC42_2144 [Sphaceloma murrayae]
MSCLRDTDKSKPYLPLAGGTQDGYNNGTEATATCFCGTVQYAFQLSDVSAPFLCNCTDCHKIHASMMGANFILTFSKIRHLRGQEKLSTYSTSKSVGTGNTMTNHFCSVCGTLMYRIGTGFPGKAIPRIGTVDDFNLMETVLKPKIEHFMGDRASWLKGMDGVEGVKRCDGFFWAEGPKGKQALKEDKL